MALIVAYGAGTNSTAMLIEMRKRNIIPDLILFSDTGGERPETYQYLKLFNDWLVSNKMPPITTIKKVDKHGEVMTLEEMCLKNKSLPSIAFGFKSCSLGFKLDPQVKYCNHFPLAIKAWKEGRKVIKAIGYDAGEERRAKDYEDNKFKAWYPLVEWDIDRDGCVQLIADAGLSQPGKSSCFFCPSMKKSEIFELRDSHPDLLKRALDMESNAELTTIPGLGRSFAWKDLIRNDANQIKMFVDVVDQTCGCYDG